MAEEKEIEINWKEVFVHILGLISGIVIMFWYCLDLFAGNMIGKMVTSLDRLVSEGVLFVEVNMILFIALIWILAYGGFLFHEELKE